jgi:hypothetical protein
LEAHPAQDESDVRLRICSRDINVTSFLPSSCPQGSCCSAIGNRKSKIENQK